MTEYNSYPALLQSTQSEYVSSETIEASNNQMSNNSNNNLIYNSAPLIVLNSQKSDMALLQNSMMNEGQAYVTIQTQSTAGANDLNGTKILNTPIIIQSSPSLPLQTSQYQQQQSTAINVQQNNTQMTSLTPSQLQSLSYLMQTQIAPQFIQTANGLLQIIPQGFITTQPQQNQGQGHDNTLQTQISGLPTIGWSLGNFNTGNIPFTLDNQLQQIQMNGIGLQQLIPVQHVIQSNNSFFTNQNDDQDQIVSTIVDLNVNDKKSFTANRKPSRRKRKPTGKLVTDHAQLSSPSVHPTSTNEVTKEAAESSGIGCRELITQYDNKGRPFNFLCPNCPKKFTLNSRLSAHMRCHTGMRPFTCNVCGFSFTQKSYLIRHAAVHKEERPFRCEKCQKSYKHYGSLANHRKLHRKDDRNDTVKIEPSASDNGRSSSISSLVINNSNDFVTSGLMLGHDEEQQLSRNHTFTSGVNHTCNDTGDSSYIKQLGLMYPVSLNQITGSDNEHIVNNKSDNIFYQQEQIDSNYGGKEGEEEQFEANYNRKECEEETTEGRMEKC